MNKKNKNKIRSKPTEPAAASQKTDSAQNIDEAITENVEEKLGSIAKESDSAIETTSEVKELVQESDEILNDTPTKPKRNKGKKKKQGEITFDENSSVSTQDSRPVLPAISDSEVKVKDENLAESMESSVSTVKKEDENIEENVTANVRKKKNKKKHHEHTQKEDVPFQEFDFLEKLPEDLKKEENVTIETKLDVSMHEITEPETKQTKKKNKKKKFEKSDKADETVICTAAFQKLISSPDNEGDINLGLNIEVPKDSGEGDKITSGEEETFKDLIQSVILPEESKQLNDETLPHDQINESKGKKKNKKDKKHLQPKPDTEKSNLPQEKIIREESSSINTDIVQEIPSVDVKYAIKDTTPIAKAKIAKPVEKKRRGKIETPEGHVNKESEDIILHDVDFKEPAFETEKISEHISATDVNVQHTDETVKAEQKIESETTIICTEKSSKTLIPTDIISPSTETPIEESNLNLAHDIKSSEAITKSSVIASNPVLLDFEQNTNEPLFSLEEPEDNKAIISEPHKTVEKKKKKHPKKIDICAEKNSEKEILLTPESKLTNETILQQNEDSGLSTLSPSIDNSIEISSLKTDELDGSSDVTPDFIHHPLATSQQLIDDNNNMVICEITTPEEKLSFHLLIPTEPIIQNSGETPEFVEEKNSNVTPSLNMTKERSVPNEPEKTDLKSKMMEVSQDMEELRLSIERSLAELTSMEKSEENVVKDINTPQLGTTTELKPSNVKDNISEKSRLITENVSGEIISSGTMESKPKEQEIICKPENIQENKLEMPLPVQSDDHRNVAVKETPPQVPVRKDNKGKGKGKRKCKQDTQFQQPTTIPETTTGTSSENTTEEVKKEEKVQPEQKSQSSESNENKGKQQQQAMQLDNCCNGSEQVPIDLTSNIAESFCEPIENFEDALTSSVDDVNKPFEMIVNEINNTPELAVQNPHINIISPTEDTETAEPKQNPVSPPKNLLGHPDIPVPSNRTDYKKEKNKPPNMRQAKVKIKDVVDIEKMEKTKQSKESQTENKRKVGNNKNVLESFSYVTNENAEYVYKYSFRKVFLQSLCHVCRKELGQRVPCQFCSLVFYCSQRHKDEDWPQHQSLCFAICTIAHLKDHKHIYADSKNITGQSYRLLRMQMIISCEKVLKRKLVPWEQEALLYPRMCADTTCREWKQSKLADCEGCGQISYCSENPTHLPALHKRWCKSYGLYQKLVHHQQTRGRLEPKLPAGIVVEGFRISDKINEVLAAMYDDKIDMTDTEYATLTQLATAPLTAAYCHELATTNHSNGISKKTSLVVHVVGAELQFEADVLFKWEVFFLHLKPQVKELKVVFISPDLNPSNLPLNLLEKVNLCDVCRAQNRRVLFNFQDKKTYHEYWAGDEFSSPDIVCAFNSSIQRSSMYNGKDTWPTAVSCILKLKVPFIITSYSIDELNRDVSRIKECSELSGVSFKTISDAKCNPFASVRPDRNFITDDEIPLLFKNYCFVVLCGI